MRNKFDEQLEKLNLHLAQMGNLCEEAISYAVKCLSEHNPEMKIKATETEKLIDQKERDIESLCMKLLIHQQPVAADFRMITSALKMISDMERIGDQAEDISEIAEYVVDCPDAPSVSVINDMAETAVYMVMNSVEAYISRNISAARLVIKMDDRMDQQFLTAKTRLIEAVQRGSRNAEALVDMLMIAKYFERIGDHAENIAEWAVFSVTGEHE